jgi:hypothetical protein
MTLNIPAAGYAVLRNPQTNKGTAFPELDFGHFRVGRRWLG